MARYCGPCSPWGQPQSTTRVCGTFDNETATPDEGRCHPYRVKRDCGRPDLPVINCDDDQYEVIPQPDNPDQPFVVSARLFDENCDTITDENGEDITTLIA